MAYSPFSLNSASGQSWNSIGTSYVTDASTRYKIATLRKSGKGGIADAAQKLLGLAGSKASSSQQKDLDPYTKNIIQSLFSAELKVHNSIGTATNKVAGSISNANQAIADDIRGVKDSLHDALQPVSSATGSVLGTLTGVLRDPLGSIDTLGKAISQQVDKTNPGFMDRLEATMKKYKVDELQHLPSTIMGGIRSLASTVDALLSLPLSIAADIYNGLMEIVKEIGQLLDTIVSGVMDLIFGPKGLLDSLLPMGELMDFLEAVSEVAGIVGSIGGAFTGLSTITSSISQIGSYASLGTATLSNPAALATSFLPPGATQFVSGLRNPDGMVSQLIPPSIKQQLGQISKLPGLGFVGNMGYSVGGTLQTLQGGVVENILGQYGSQAGILGPLLGKPSQNKPYYDQTASRPPAISGASTNPKIPVNANHGTPVDTSPPKKVIAEKNDYGSGPIDAAGSSVLFASQNQALAYASQNGGINLGSKTITNSFSYASTPQQLAAEQITNNIY